MPKKSKRSVAGKKSWETRRRNARSLAAKRGWRTRRKNIRKKKVKRRKPIKEFMVNLIHEEQSKHSPRVEVQISVRGPGRTRQQAIDAVVERIRTGGNKKGWKSDIKVWEKASKRYNTKNNDAYWNVLTLIEPTSKVV